MAGVPVVLLAAFALVTPVESVAAVPVPDVWASESGGPGNARTNAGETALTPTTAPNARLRWTRADDSSNHGAPTIVEGVGYEVVNQATPAQPSQFEAFSVGTGETLWSVALPRDGVYRYGVSVVGHVAVMSFDGHTRAGGVTAVGLNTQRVLWSTRQPAPVPPAGGDGTTSGPIVTDGTLVYLFGGTSTIATFGFADGKPSWKVTARTNRPTGIALGNRTVFTGGSKGVIAYDAATGSKLWAAPGLGAPVVAGGRVITAAGSRLMAVAAGGCGAAQCDPLWDVVVPHVSSPAVGGVDDATGYLAYTDSARPIGGLVRFSAISGKVLWRAQTLAGAVAPVRGGVTVWTVAGGTTLVGFSTTAAGVRPLCSIVEAADAQGSDQTLAIASGKVFVRSSPSQLTAYGLARG